MLVCDLHVLKCIYVVKSSVEATVVLSRTDRAYEISQKVYYRSLRRLQTLQKQCSSSLEKLQISINLVS